MTEYILKLRNFEFVTIQFLAWNISTLKLWNAIAKDNTYCYNIITQQLWFCLTYEPLLTHSSFVMYFLHNFSPTSQQEESELEDKIKATQSCITPRDSTVPQQISSTILDTEDLYNFWEIKTRNKKYINNRFFCFTWNVKLLQLWTNFPAKWKVTSRENVNSPQTACNTENYKPSLCQEKINLE